jgi:transposase
VQGIKTAAVILARRVQALDAELDTIDIQLAPLVKAAAPGMLNIFGVGVDTAAMVIVAAGDNPERIVSESAWAMICGVAPIPVMSGKSSNRYRFNPGGNRQANNALWRIVMTRLSQHEPRTNRLHATPSRRRQIEGRDHPLPQALRRSRNLPSATALNQIAMTGLAR